MIASTLPTSAHTYFHTIVIIVVPDYDLLIYSLLKHGHKGCLKPSNHIWILWTLHSIRFHEGVCQSTWPLIWQFSVFDLGYLVNRIFIYQYRNGPVAKCVHCNQPVIVSLAVTFIFYTAGQNVKYLESSMEVLVFDILICWKWLGTNCKHLLWL